MDIRGFYVYCRRKDTNNRSVNFYTEHMVDCRVFQVYKKNFQHSENRKEKEFFVIVCNDWVQAIALQAWDEHED